MKVSEGILANKRIVLTRAIHQNESFINLLKDHKAIPIIFPTIEIHPIEDMSFLDEAIQKIQDYNYILFTSSNAVEIFFDRWKHLGKSFPDFHQTKIIAVGKSTAHLLKESGAENVLFPAKYLANEIPSILQDINHSKILIPQSDLAKQDLINNLKELGANVDAITIYRNTIPTNIDASVLNQPIDFITFTSPSTSAGWIHLIKKYNIDLFPGFTYICIGSETNKRAIETGITDAIVAQEHSIEGMLKAMINYEQLKQKVIQY